MPTRTLLRHCRPCFTHRFLSSATALKPITMADTNQPTNHVEQLTETSQMEIVNATNAVSNNNDETNTKRQRLERVQWERTGKKGKKKPVDGYDRRWGTRPEGEEGAATTTTTSEDGNKARQPKRKVVLLMGFCGTGYQGMQVNPGAKTIEGDLFRAMIEAGAVSRDNADDHKKIGLMRAARTDKGVHAAGQAVSLKMIIEDPSIVDKVNALLPEQIRVWGFVRCINSFHAKNMCDSRIYEYLLPTYVLQPREAFGVAGNTAVTTVASSIDASGNRIYTNVETGEQHTWTAPEPSTPEEMAQRRTYRINQVTLEKVRQALSSYEGTHNYHNYTCGKRFSEESAKRFIISFKASDPFIQQGTEWLSLKVHGQSFMIHQIRKMVSMMVLLVRSETPFTVIPQSFEATRINIPKAPGLGLLLEQTVFGSYNRKCIETGREQVTFEKYQDKIDAFKRAYIYERIVEEEIAVNEFDSWIKSVDARMHYFPFINKEGIVTEADEVLSEGGDDTEVAAEE